MNKVFRWAAACLLKCAAGITAQVLQDASSRRGAGSQPSSTATPQGKS